MYTYLYFFLIFFIVSFLLFVRRIIFFRYPRFNKISIKSTLRSLSPTWTRKLPIFRLSGYRVSLRLVRPYWIPHLLLECSRHFNPKVKLSTYLIKIYAQRSCETNMCLSVNEIALLLFYHNQYCNSGYLTYNFIYVDTMIY